MESNFLGSSLLGVADFSAAMDHGAGGTSLFSRSIVAIKALLAIVGLEENESHIYRLLKIDENRCKQKYKLILVMDALGTVVPTKSDSDIIMCLQLLSKI